MREQIDAKIAEWREEGKAVLLPGLLFIDEIHALDMEAFSFLSRALESPNAPVLVMASNRGVTRVADDSIPQDQQDITPHGIPTDLLDRLVVVSLDPLTDQEAREIVQLRAIEEDVELDAGALVLLTKIAREASLRYACNLISLAALIRGRKTRTGGLANGGSSSSVHAAAVLAEDVERAYQLFLDEKRSAAAAAEASAAAAAELLQPIEESSTRVAQESEEQEVVEEEATSALGTAAAVFADQTVEEMVVS